MPQAVIAEKFLALFNAYSRLVTAYNALNAIEVASI
jgi:hypothetical protein